MSGHLIVITGLSGAGKTTLIREALVRLPTLRYLTTYTTRPPRDNDTDSLEHVFVDTATYKERQKSAVEWDHAEYGGYFYGADVSAVKKLLQTHDVICAIAPDPRILAMLSQYYTITRLIWIDTPADVAKSRISDDKARFERKETPELRTEAHTIFVPDGDLDTDKISFLKMLRELLF